MREQHNTIAYTYRNDRQVPGDGHTITHLPQRIDYTGNTGAGTAATHAVVFDTFDYIQHASAFTGGMLTNHSPAVSRIRMLGPGDAPVRVYNLTWNSGTNGRARIEIVQECGRASFTDCRPPTRLTWLNQPGNGFTEVDTGISYPTHPAGHGYTETGNPNSHIAYPLQELDPSYKWLLADVTGDGLSDLVISQASLIACPLPPMPIVPVAAIGGGSIFPHLFVDNADNLHCAIGNWNVATNLGGKLGGLTTWRQTALPDLFETGQYGSFGHQAFDVVPIDMNHDGRTDVLYYDSGQYGNSIDVNVLTNPASVNASTLIDGASTGIAIGASISGKEYSDSGVLYADMNGDGMLDAITCDEGPLSDISGRSTGSWQLHLWDPQSRRFASSDVGNPQATYIPIDQERGCYLRSYIHVVDVDGDGKAELLIPPMGYPKEESTQVTSNGTTQLPPQCVSPCEYRAIQRDNDANQRDVVLWRDYNTKLSAPDWSQGPGRVLFVDVNGDGLPDALVSTAIFQNRLSTILNTGDGFAPTGFPILPLSFPVTQVTYLDFAATLDYDGDGQTDVLLPMKDPMCNLYQMETCWVVLRSDPSAQGALLADSVEHPVDRRN